MTSRARWALLVVLLVVFAVTVWAAGRRDEPPPPAAGVERLGPDSGELVADYLRRARESLPPAGGAQVWALVELDDYLGPVDAAALVRGARLSSVVLRVPLPRVQTALVFRELPGQRPVAELLDALRAAGQDRATAAAQDPPGSRSSAMGTAEAARLQAGCSCVLAMLVRADGRLLRELIARPGVRAVHAALPGTPPQALALSPLLPEQRDVVGPVPDDGPLPGISSPPR